MMHFSLDLELNNYPGAQRPKIIQVGICIADIAQPEDKWLVKKWYLDPQEFIDPFITDLTGITNNDILINAIPHDHLRDELAHLFDHYRPFVNPITWGGGDAQELKAEFRDRNIDFPYFGHRCVDIKTWHVMQQLAAGKSAKGSLSSVLGKHKLQFKGKAHRADEDAFNTMRLFAHYMRKQQHVNSLIESVKQL